MNWDAVGAVGETIGALAVVITLAYLAIQIRVSRTVAADANRLTRTNGVRDWCLFVCGNDKMLSTLIKAHGLEGYFEAFGKAFDLSPEEAARLDFQNQYFFWLHYGQYASTNDSKSTEELRKLARKFYKVPCIKYSWENSPYGKSFLEPEFVEFIDEIAEAGSTTPGRGEAPPNKRMNSDA
jgi:hypothetical protein